LGITYSGGNPYDKFHQDLFFSDAEMLQGVDKRMMAYSDQFARNLMPFYKLIKPPKRRPESVAKWARLIDKAPVIGRLFGLSNYGLVENMNDNPILLAASRKAVNEKFSKYEVMNNVMGDWVEEMKQFPETLVDYEKFEASFLEGLKQVDPGAIEYNKDGDITKLPEFLDTKQKRKNLRKMFLQRTIELKNRPELNFAFRQLSGIKAKSEKKAVLEVMNKNMGDADQYWINLDYLYHTGKISAELHTYGRTLRGVGKE
jgi:hypothetical protein